MKAFVQKNTKCFTPRAPSSRQAAGAANAGGAFSSPRPVRVDARLILRTSGRDLDDLAYVIGLRSLFPSDRLVSVERLPKGPPRRRSPFYEVHGGRVIPRTLRERSTRRRRMIEVDPAYLVGTRQQVRARLKMLACQRRFDGVPSQTMARRAHVSQRTLFRYHAAANTIRFCEYEVIESDDPRAHAPGTFECSDGKTRRRKPLRFRMLAAVQPGGDDTEDAPSYPDGTRARRTPPIVDAEVTDEPVIDLDALTERKARRSETARKAAQTRWARVRGQRNHFDVIEWLAEWPSPGRAITVARTHAMPEGVPFTVTG